jgi:hypothetical protein
MSGSPLSHLFHVESNQSVGTDEIDERRLNMRHIARTLVLVVALAVAGSAFAAVPQSSSGKKSTPASHTVKGTVKSLDNSSLVAVAQEAAT